MKWAFWVSLGMILYTYAGYPVWLWIRSRWRPQPVRLAPILPSVSIVMAVHNEDTNIHSKLRNLLQLDYPPDRYEIVVVSDGSTDATNEILASLRDERLHVILIPQHQGKAHALNCGIELARSEVIVFTDARQLLEADAVTHLVANFADPTVGCVSGALFFGRPGGLTALDGSNLYWCIEKKIRHWESLTGSATGATGALYAIRRSLVVPLPVKTILDDVYLPLHVIRQGARVVFESRARAWDALSPTPRQEFRRKVRTLTGNYQLLRLAPWVLTRANSVRLEFVSHKLLRLLVPFALLTVMVASIMIPGGFYNTCVGLQLAFYSLGGLGLAHRKTSFVARLGNVALTFLVLNSAAVVALVSFITGKKEVWVR